MGKLRTFYVAPGSLSLPSITALHPMSDAVRVDKLPAGSMYDSASGEALDQIDVQLLGAHPSRVFYMPEDRKEQNELIQQFPELANVTGNRICSSANGHSGTVGVYMGQHCATCPHVSTCSERTVALVHRTGDGASAVAREMPVNWASGGTFTRMLTQGRMLGVDPWGVVYTLGAVEKPNRRGVSVVLTIKSSRLATPDEVAEAEAVLNSMVAPVIEMLMGGTTTQPMLVAGDSGQQALPESARTTQPGEVTVRSEDPIVAGPAEEPATEPAAPPMAAEVDAQPARPRPRPRIGAAVGGNGGASNG